MIKTLLLVVVYVGTSYTIVSWLLTNYLIKKHTKLYNNIRSHLKGVKEEYDTHVYSVIFVHIMNVDDGFFGSNIYKKGKILKYMKEEYNRMILNYPTTESKNINREEILDKIIKG